MFEKAPERSLPALEDDATEHAIRLALGDHGAVINEWLDDRGEGYSILIALKEPFRREPIPLSAIVPAGVLDRFGDDAGELALHPAFGVNGFGLRSGASGIPGETAVWRGREVVREKFSARQERGHP